MLNLFIVFCTVLLFAAISWFLWKSGFLAQAEKPEPLIDKPVMDAKERRAVLKRLKRWREEGKLTRQEYENVSALCRSEWDGPDEEK